MSGMMWLVLVVAWREIPAKDLSNDYNHAHDEIFNSCKRKQEGYEHLNNKYDQDQFESPFFGSQDTNKNNDTMKHGSTPAETSREDIDKENEAIPCCNTTCRCLKCLNNSLRKSCDGNIDVNFNDNLISQDAR